MYDVLYMCEYVIKCYNERQWDITNLKLQKILYYLQGYFYKEHGMPAFDEDIYNWPYGPVVPDAYFEYSSFGSTPIYLSELGKECSEAQITNKEHRKTVDKVLAVCHDKASSQLVAMTHNEEPWKSTKRSQLISKDSIERYFDTHNPLNVL